MDTFVCAFCSKTKDLKKRKSVSKSQCGSCYSVEYRYKYPEKTKQFAQTSRNNRKEKTKLENKIYKLVNKERLREAKNLYRKLNPDSRKGEAQFRKKRIKRATPNWVNEAEIKDFYKKCPEGFQVDHIIPLLNKDVCGLHVIHNLQYIPAEQNNKKNNLWDGTYDNKGWAKCRY